MIVGVNMIVTISTTGKCDKGDDDKVFHIVLIIMASIEGTVKY